jgi:hypothetical protein
MEDAEKSYNHEDEVIRMYENIDDEGTNPNGQGEGKE